MIELVEFVELKNKLSDIITEKHHTDNLIDILIFKSKVNGEMKIEDQEKLKELNKKSEELSDKEKELRERMKELRREKLNG